MILLFCPGVWASWMAVSLYSSEKTYRNIRNVSFRIILAQIPDMFKFVFIILKTKVLKIYGTPARISEVKIGISFRLRINESGLKSYEKNHPIGYIPYIQRDQ
jgi:hypothetical protein